MARTGLGLVLLSDLRFLALEQAPNIVSVADIDQDGHEERHAKKWIRPDVQ